AIVYTLFPNVHEVFGERDPGIPLYGSRLPPNGTFFEMSVIRYSCHAGHILVGPAMSTCLRRAHGGLSWLPSELPLCQLTTCQTPAIAHGHAFDYNYTANSTLLAWCTSGLHLSYPAASASRATCLSNGSWDVLPTCRGCETPLPVSHSWLSENVSLNGTYPVGSSILYTCYPGYSMHGAQRISCTKHLTWSQEPPTCLPSQLPKPPENGYFLCHPSPCDRYVSRTVLEYYCRSGYTLKGDYKFHTCQDGVWSPPLQVSCLPSQDSATSPWAIVAATASSVVLILLLIMLLVLLQPRLKSLRHNRQDTDYSMKLCVHFCSWFCMVFTAIVDQISRKDKSCFPGLLICMFYVQMLLYFLMSLVREFPKKKKIIVQATAFFF
uniref:Sushi domain containing 4 n=1 Tax=Eptatretus burgeri TaxID=7764 RepID=A0A8C4Q4W2_EPTBU